MLVYLEERKMGVRTHFRILWQNTATKQVLVQSAVNTSTNGMYYTFPVLPDMPRGEYEYFIVPDGGTLELYTNDVRNSTIDGEKITIFDRGVARVGKLSRTDVSYNVAKEYEQYNG